ncbi:hypothetical protein [Paenibacillus alkalitolerans]|uniref:hypothetical protein n=1 Tax=Paenibacillus alkalitolerans TaxID=2799335 RepID=UPI0018F2D34F|nr:hypothetical protein [Paenibacillus alkalitolerans]
MKKTKGRRGDPIKCRIFLSIILVFILVTGCSERQQVDTPASQTYKDDIYQLSNIIKDVRVYFLRPDLFIQIDLSGEPGNELADEILLRTKEFVTIENMTEVAESINWDLEISNVHLTFNTDSDENIEHEYYARYFKTFDASDKSKENIEGYRNWYKD